jgi:hypothetical protein
VCSTIRQQRHLICRFGLYAQTLSSRSAYSLTVSGILYIRSVLNSVTVDVYMATLDFASSLIVVGARSRQSEWLVRLADTT